MDILAAHRRDARFGMPERPNLGKLMRDAANLPEQ